MVGFETFQLIALFIGHLSLGKPYIIASKGKKILFVKKTEWFDVPY